MGEFDVRDFGGAADTLIERHDSGAARPGGCEGEPVSETDVGIPQACGVAGDGWSGGVQFDSERIYGCDGAT